MYRYLILACMPLMTACATTEGYEKLLNSWVGVQEIDLVRTWGPPVRAYETSGRKFLSYESQRKVFIPGTAPILRTQVVGNTAHTTSSGGSPATNVAMSCVTTFEVEGSKVVSWTHKGNDCKAEE